MSFFKRLRGKSPQPPTARAAPETTPTTVTKASPGSLSSTPTLVERPAPTVAAPDKRDPPPESLWERAYSQLRDEKPELVEGFEQLVQNADAKDSSLGVDGEKAATVDKRATHASIERICATSHSAMENAETKFKVRNKEYKAHDVFAKGIKIMAWAKDLAGLATSASPEASIACAAVFLVLPLFENLDKVKEANESGFIYVAASMRYYLALEPELLGIRGSLSAEVMSHAETSIVDLYREVLTFQLQSAIRFNRNKFKNKFRDMFDYDGWEGLLQSVKDAEALVALRWDRIQSTITVRDLSSLRQEAHRSFEELTGQVGDLIALARAQAETTKEIAQTVRRIEERALTDEENSHLRALRRQDAANNLSYEQAKARTEDRVPGTCQWLLEDDEYKTWVSSECGLLLVSADPGCGKSVLSKYLVDEVLPREDSTVCYFFFKDEDQDRLDQALAALLHQLMCARAFLVNDYLKPVSEKNGDSLRSNTSLLWDILEKSLNDSRTGPVVIVVDGLDECKIEDVEELAQYTSQLFSTPPGESKHQTSLLMTTRPYLEITSQFEAAHLQISGAKHSDLIREEVKLVISHRLVALRKMPSIIPAKLLPVLEQKLLSIDHPTYLWMSLTFKFIQSKGFKKTAKGIDQAIDRLPRTINEAYEKILDRTDVEERSRVIKALTIVLGAVRPLTVSEMNVAMNYESEMEAMDEFDLEEDVDFESGLRDLTGFFLAIYNNQVYFLHQTVREFLRGQDDDTLKDGKWQGSISPADANLLLGRMCVHYLWMYNNATELPVAVEESLQMPSMTDEERAFWGRDHLSLTQCIAIDPCTALFEYATQKGPQHLQDEPDDELWSALVQLITQPKTKMWYYWALSDPVPEDPLVNVLFTAVWAGITGAVRRLVKMPEVKATTVMDHENCTALYRAVDNDHLATARVLLEAGASAEIVVDGEIYIPMAEAALRGNLDMMRLLVEFGANPATIGRTSFQSDASPIHQAIENFHEEALAFLVKHGADINCMAEVRGIYDGYRGTPLHSAVYSYSSSMVEAVLSLGADVNARDTRGGRALDVARREKWRDVERMLIEAGAVGKEDPDPPK